MVYVINHARFIAILPVQSALDQEFKLTHGNEITAELVTE